MKKDLFIYIAAILFGIGTVFYFLYQISEEAKREKQSYHITQLMRGVGY